MNARRLSFVPWLKENWSWTTNDDEQWTKGYFRCPGWLSFQKIKDSLMYQCDFRLEHIISQENEKSSDKKE